MLDFDIGFTLTFLYQQPWLSSYWGIWTPVWSWARLRNVKEFIFALHSIFSQNDHENQVCTNFEKEVTLPCSRDSLKKNARSTTNKRVLAAEWIMSDLFILFLVLWTFWLVVRHGSTCIVWTITAPSGSSFLKLIVSCWGSQFISVCTVRRTGPNFRTGQRPVKTGPGPVLVPIWLLKIWSNFNA